MSGQVSCEMSGYWTPDGIACERFRLPPEGLDDGQRAEAYEMLRDYLAFAKENFVGYQSNMGLSFDHLAEFLNLSLNNIGDSFSTKVSEANPHPDGYFTVNCKWMERAVLDYYADLWHAPRPRRVEVDGGDDWLDTYWGYVLSMGSTEGNLIGLRNARDYLSGVCLQFDQNAAEADGTVGTSYALDHLSYLRPDGADDDPAYQPVLLFSDSTHYSVAKIAQIIAVTPQKVAVDDDGAISLDDLYAKAKDAVDKGHPIIVVLNYGTTFTGAYDNVEGAIDKLKPLLVDDRPVTCTGHDMPIVSYRTNHWFHVDGALGAGYVPYLQRAGDDGEFDASAFPRFDFELPIQSMTVSGHKWPGAPSPTGVFMTLNKYLLTTDVPAYVGALDSTLAGSRSGFAALALWDQLARLPEADQRARAVNAMELAEHALEELTRIFGSKARRPPGSLAVLFPRQPPDLIAQFALASTRDESHLLVMPHVTKKLIDALITEIETRPAEAATASPAQAAADNLRLGW